jgi:putative ABC transport system permease protein
LVGTLSLNVLERTREFGVLRAIGAADGAVRAIVLTEGLLIGLLSWLGATLLAVPVGRLFVEIVATLTRTPLPYAFAPLGVLVWLAIALVLAALASIVPARRAVRLSVRAALAYE